MAPNLRFCKARIRSMAERLSPINEEEAPEVDAPVVATVEAAVPDNFPLNRTFIVP